jgi:hypothetical protein
MFDENNQMREVMLNVAVENIRELAVVELQKKPRPMGSDVIMRLPM